MSIGSGAVCVKRMFSMVVVVDFLSILLKLGEVVSVSRHSTGILNNGISIP